MTPDQTTTETLGLARMIDEAQIHWIAMGDRTHRLPVVMLHGGPGLPDYLGDVAAMIADLAPVYRYDQRGTGRSEWQGHHSLARHVDDLAELLDAWGASRAVLIGHSYGADLASRFCLAHPDRVAGLLLLCGPFVGDWRTAYRAERARRMTTPQQERLGKLEALARRTEEQEIELLTLAWFTDHADSHHGRRRAAHEARRRRPVNWAMNSELSKENHADPIEQHLDELRACLPTHTELLGGVADPRPVSALESLARRLEVPLTRIDGGGHEPWLEQPEHVRRHLRRFVQRAVSPS
ncbi:alpha/beta hydrolase [Catenulispora yoronensis]|uniref:alpha/beta fold hydrolase n=1 Tax=Catenulispora yoronensis TaxID=450799 RepID=UPI0031CE92FF